MVPVVPAAPAAAVALDLAFAAVDVVAALAIVAGAAAGGTGGIAGTGIGGGALGEEKIEPIAGILLSRSVYLECYQNTKKLSTAL